MLLLCFLLGGFCRSSSSSSFSESSSSAHRFTDEVDLLMTLPFFASPLLLSSCFLSGFDEDSVVNFLVLDNSTDFSAEDVEFDVCEVLAETDNGATIDGVTSVMSTCDSLELTVGMTGKIGMLEYRFEGDDDADRLLFDIKLCIVFEDDFVACFSFALT